MVTSRGLFLKVNSFKSTDKDSMNNASNYIIAFSVFILAFMMVFLDRYNRLESPFAIKSNNEILFLSEGGSLDDLIPILSEYEIEFDSDELMWVAGIKGWSSFRPGRYELGPHSSYNQFLSRLSRGEQDPFMVRIGGGMEFDRFALRVANQFLFTSDELIESMKDSVLLADLGIEEHHLIGRMLPNSYEMYWTTTPEQFVRRMMREFDVAVTNPYMDRASELSMTIDEITTLASIIEWEVRHVDEKAKVSGLYWNRLNRRMRLQADPTVVYAIGERRRLFNSDYRVVHPYNTYTFRGLPPGPINNPRITSIQAALFPENHDYLFMVAAPGTGYHTFTTDFQDHLRESRRWSAWISEQHRLREQREREEQNSQTQEAS
ncbi:MAG: endolytic transglycosylase MltG [Balneolales bacterium]|nr:endolytic transglycosylase MltG [Balneolales bacterium]